MKPMRDGQDNDMTLLQLLIMTAAAVAATFVAVWLFLGKA